MKSVMIKKYGGLFFTNNALEDFVQRAKIQVNNKCNSSGSHANYMGQKTRFCSPLNSTAVLNLNCSLVFSSSRSFCTFLKKYQKRGSRVRHSVLPLFKSRFATSFSRFTPRRSLLVAMLGAARTRCAQTSCRLVPSIARLLAVPPNAALPPLAGNHLLQLQRN